jgi:hypothetical protein
MNQDPTSRFFRAITLLITFAIKLGGLVVVMYEVFSTRSANRAEILAVAAFMMAGAQLSETLILGAIDRLVGKDTK